MSDAVTRYKYTAGKLRKLQRIVFKKQENHDISIELQELAVKFESNCFLSAYAGLCFLGVAKCEEGNGNDSSAMFLKAGRAFRNSEKSKNKLLESCHDQESDGAQRSYFQALASRHLDSVMKACIIREMRELNHNLMLTSHFLSQIHLNFELDDSANQSIKANDFIGALERFTEIAEDIDIERRCSKSYETLMKKIEISRLFLIMLIDLPLSRHSASTMRLLEKYTTWNSIDIEMSSLVKSRHDKLFEDDLSLLLENLVFSCQNFHAEGVKEVCEEISQHKFLTVEHISLLMKIVKKFEI